MTRSILFAFSLLLPLSASAQAQEDRSPELRRSTRAYASDIVKCYGRAHKKHPDARGSVTVRIDLVDQHATETEVTETTIAVRALERCVERRTSRWFYEGVANGSYSWRFDFRVGTDDRS